MSKIGILALQGDFEKHASVIKKLNHEPLYIREPQALKQCSHLIIPGGESTTFLKLIDRLNLRLPIQNFAKDKPVFGTCAGLIILARQVLNNSLDTLALIDIEVQRNAYGRQIDSFIDDINIINDAKPFEAVFIRAPKILKCYNDTQPLAKHKNDIVMARQKNILVASFHPELTDDYRIHTFFLNHFV